MAKSNSSVSKSGKSAEISAQEKIVQLKKDELAIDAEIARNAKRKLEHFESLEKSGRKLTDIQKEEVKYAKEDLKLQADKEKALKDEQKALSKLYELENKRKKLLKDSIEDADEFATSLRSLGAQIGKDNKLFETMNSRVDSVATTLNSVGQIVAELGDDQENLKKQVINASDAYKNLNTNIAVAGKKLMQQKITQSEYNDLIKDSYENFDELVSKIDQSTEAGRDLYKIMLASKNEMESFSKAAEKSEKMMKGLGVATNQLASSGIPAAGELGNVIEKIGQGGKGLGLAFFALGAAMADVAYNAGLIGNKIEKLAKHSRIMAGITGEISVQEQNIGLGQYEGGGANQRNFVAEEAGLQFGAQMQNMAASFQAASKTALFGKGLGSVGYGAAQLQLAGISAETIASQMQAAGDATGKMPSGKIAADMAVMASRTGQSAEGIASINEAFMRMDGLTEEGALNMQEGLRAMAEQANINLGGLMTEMAESSKEMLGYQIKSGSALAKQVTFARSMGVSFSDIAKAGQSMVLNYKDSIKSEMQLSAMLGKNVDLSEVRAKFASGDTEGALNALKAQGLDPANMDMFQQQMLQQATGMDLNTLSKINKNTGRSGGELKAGDTEVANKQFLATKSSTEATLQLTQAMIAAKTAIEQTILGTQQEQLKQGYIEKGIGPLAQLEKDKATEEARYAIDSGLDRLGTDLLGGIASFGLYKGASALMKGKPGVPTGVPSSPQPSGPITKSGTPDMRFKANKVATGGIDDIAKAGSKGAGGMMKGLGKAAKFGGRLLGKVAAPLAIGMALYDGFQGFNADKDASVGDKILNAGSSVLNGLTFGLLGKDSDTIKAEAEAKKGTPAAQAATTVAATGGTSVTAEAKTAEKWMQDKLTYMSGNLERVVDRTHKTMMNTAATTKELQTLNTNTKAIMNLTKTIEALTVATYEGKGNVAVMIDGKKVAYAFDKYKENTRGGDPNEKTN